MSHTPQAWFPKSHVHLSATGHIWPWDEAVAEVPYFPLLKEEAWLFSVICMQIKIKVNPFFLPAYLFPDLSLDTVAWF